MAFKLDLKTIFILAIVAMFVLQSLAIQSSMGQSEPAATPTPTGIAGNPVYAYAAVNATIVSYAGGEVVVTGTGVGSQPEMRDALARLKTQGEVTYFTSPTTDMLDIIVPSIANVTGIAWALQPYLPPGGNITSHATLELPANITFTTASGNVTAPGGFRISGTIAPFLSEGSRLPVGLHVYLIGTNITDASAELLEMRGTVAVNASVSNLSGDWQAGSAIPWGARAIDVAGLNASLSRLAAKHSLSYLQNDSVIILAALNASQAAAAASLPFVVSAGGNLLTLEPNFTDEEAATQAIRSAIGDNASVHFPDSLLSASLAGTNATAEEISAALNGTGAALKRSGTLTLSGNITIDGQSYPIPAGTTVSELLPANATLGGSAPYSASYIISAAAVTSLR